jgi:hypothetical protein
MTDSVSSAPADLGEQPSLSFEEITFTTAREVEDGDESDDDESVAPEEEPPEAGDESVDTQVVNQIAAQPERRFADDTCLVALSQKVKGRTILCGHPRGTCRRRGHQSLQGIEGHRGQPGMYSGVMN